MKGTLSIVFSSLLILFVVGLSSSEANAQCPSPAVFGATVAIDSNVTCNGLSNGGVTASAAGATAPLTFNWNTSDTIASITGLNAGTYTVTITDNNGCTGISSGTVNQPTNLIVIPSVDSNATCNGFANGGATAASGGGTLPYTYAWSNGATTASNSGISAGTYTITLSDANGCSTSGMISISETTFVIASAVVDSIVNCSGDSTGGASASATGGAMPYVYSWNNGDTLASISGVPAGIYQVTVTDTNNCFDTTSIMVAENAAISVVFTEDTSIICNGDATAAISTVVSGGTAPYSYSWSTGDTVNANLDNLVAGIYTVNIVDTNGCLGADSIIISEPFIPTSADTAVACDSYTWAVSGATYVASGAYNFTDTTANGCDSIITLNLTILSSTSSSSSVTACFSYNWSQNGMTYTQSGIYTDTLTNAVGCDSIISLDLTIEEADVSIVRQGFKLIALATGGNPTFQWLDCSNGDTAITGATTNSYLVLENGMYAVEVTQNGGCKDTSVCVDVTNVGIEDLNSIKETFNVYPNPTNGIVTIEQSLSNSNERLIVRSILGRVVLESAINKTSTQINLNQLEDGIYFIQIGKTTRKVVLAR